jgi:general nucleoside transport system permease protein
MWAKHYSITQYFSALGNLFEVIWKGSFGTPKKAINTLIYITPLLFTGIAHSVAFKTGLFNIGVAGQFVLGMIAAGLVGLIPGLPSWIHIPLIILAGIIAGGLWGAVPGYLKAKLGTNEVVNTIMMNYIGLYFVNWVVLRTVFTVKGKACTAIIQQSAQLPRFNAEISRANIGIIFAIVCAVLIYWLLWKTKIGFEIRSVGHSPLAAEYGGVNIAKNTVLAMVLSGAIAGIGGALHVSGTMLNVTDMTVLPSYGFDGIAVALLAKSNPIGCIASAVLFGALRSSSKTLQLNGIPKEIVYLIQGVVIIFVATDYIYKYIAEKKRKGAMING